jgi:hypothetical protein
VSKTPPEIPADVARLSSEVEGLRRSTQSCLNLSSDLQQLRRQLLPSSISRENGFESMILPTLPSIFDDFRAKRFNILWRGSRDGFSAAEFHSRCDGQGNTLTLVEDTRGFIFGGFTPAKWESGPYHSRGDESLKSFLFTVKNPMNTQPMRFPLRPDRKDSAIWCYGIRGPGFGGSTATKCDLQIRDNSNANDESAAIGFGSVYTNSTGLDGPTFLTGTKKFTVKEIEVFEVVEVVELTNSSIMIESADTGTFVIREVDRHHDSNLGYFAI